MADVNMDFQAHGLTDKESHIYLSSWRKGTVKQYNIYLEKWTVFCVKFKVKPNKPSVYQVIRFLSELFHNGLGYSAIGTARSAISNYAEPVDGFQLGSHPKITRFIKGIYNLKPPKPKYTHAWDVNTVLEKIRSWMPLKDISLKLLTFKTIMLLALSTAQRTQTLHSLNTEEMIWTQERVVLKINKLLKHNKEGQPLDEFEINKYKHPSICPYRSLKEYCKRTEQYREEHKELWLTLEDKPHPASKDTISRWLKTTMKLSGIDTKIFKAHSTRMSSTSKTVLTIPVNTILKRARWTNANTFARFYKRKIQEDARSFQNAVLRGVIN